jgi:hypothetical protein
MRWMSCAPRALSLSLSFRYPDPDDRLPGIPLRDGMFGPGRCYVRLETGRSCTVAGLEPIESGPRLSEKSRDDVGR